MANSPSFLLDRLRKDISVRYVIENMQLSDILDRLRVGLDSIGNDASTLVSLYIYLVALSATDPSDKNTWKQIEALDLSSLEWGDIIRNLISADAVPTTTREFTISSAIQI